MTSLAILRIVDSASNDAYSGAPRSLGLVTIVVILFPLVGFTAFVLLRRNHFFGSRAWMNSHPLLPVLFLSLSSLSLSLQWTKGCQKWERRPFGLFENFSIRSRFPESGARILIHSGNFGSKLQFPLFLIEMFKTIAPIVKSIFVFLPFSCRL